MHLNYFLISAFVFLGMHSPTQLCATQIAIARKQSGQPYICKFKMCVCVAGWLARKNGIEFAILSHDDDNEQFRSQSFADSAQTITLVFLMHTQKVLYANIK